MLIGVPKEIKVHEYRVSVPPAGVRELVKNGHQVIVQQDAAETVSRTMKSWLALQEKAASQP